MQILTDSQQKVKTLWLFFLEFFKVIIATLPSIFVPQSCNGQICELNENFEDLSDYNKFVIVFNFITLISFVLSYIYEYRREKFCIKYLDIDYEIKKTNLNEEIEEYPEIKDKMYKINKKYKYISLFLIGINFLNLLFSAILVFGMYYLDNKTISVFLTNTILIGGKLYSMYNTSYYSVYEELCYSAYMTNPICYNTIDTLFKKNQTEIENQIEIENQTEIEIEFENENENNEITERPIHRTNSALGEMNYII
jgi:hypothetical protein